MQNIKLFDVIETLNNSFRSLCQNTNQLQCTYILLYCINSFKRRHMEKDRRGKNCKSL